MAQVRIPILGTTDVDETTLIAGREESINLYLHDKYLASMPGLNLQLTSTINSGPIRALFEHHGILYGVSADKFIQYDLSGSLGSIPEITRGTIITTSGFAKIIANNTQLMIIEASNAWVYTIATEAFVEVTDVDLIGFKDAVAIDGYAFVIADDSQEVQSSVVNDFTNYSSLDNSFTLDKYDNTVGLASLRGELFVFSEASTEIFYNASNPTDFPFSKRNELQIDVGCSAKESIVATEDTIFWLDNHRRISLMNGYTPTIISTASLNKEIGGFSTVSDAVGFYYTVGGQEFYHITFPTVNKSFAYNVNTQTWSIIGDVLTDETPGSALGEKFSRSLISAHAFIAGDNVVGDFAAGKLYYLDFSTHSGLNRARITNHISADNRNVFIREFELIIEPGQGAIGESPLVGLEVSLDGGFTFGAKLFRDAGKIGDHLNRIVWRNLGRGRHIAFRISCSENMNFKILEAFVTVEVGTI